MYTGFKSGLKKLYPSLILAGWLLVFISATAGTEEELHQLALRTQLKLNTLHNAESGFLKIRQFELYLNDEGFLRYRRTYVNGKQEYYSFNLMRISAINYLGNNLSGELSIQTHEDDVIVQTFNDRNGNVDSMATYFRLPVSILEAEDMVALHNDLLEMKRLLDRNK